MKNQTYGEALGLTYCGQCGLSANPLYWNESDPIDDRKNWLCLDCWEKQDGDHGRPEAGDLRPAAD